MQIWGANAEATLTGKPLRDGSVALIDDGRVVYASGEERHTRTKAAGGYRSALRAFGHRGKFEEDDAVFMSSCCEPRRATTNNIHWVDHHLSHAAFAFYGSGFDRALVCVMDDGGDVLDASEWDGRWWAHKRQQVSYYLGEKGSLQLVGRDFDKQGTAGFGEIFRAFSYFLGWPSGRHAGKVMALAGTRAFLENEVNLFSFDAEMSIASRLDSFDPFQPLRTAHTILRNVAPEIDWAPRYDGEISEQNLLAAKIVQSSLEQAWLKKIAHFKHKFSVENVCLAGGVAMNCQAVGEVRRRLNMGVFVPPAAGDQGQALGNAIIGHMKHYPEPPSFDQMPFWGTQFDGTADEINAKLRRYSVNASVNLGPLDSQLRKLAKLLLSGEIIFWFQGRSEYGPRALGNRSILAAPTSKNIRLRLNNLKGREAFNPFAASSLHRHASKFFEDAYESPYMTETFVVRRALRAELAGVVHDDGTCRAQIFSRSFNPRFYDLITEYGKLSGFHILLNTSLNGPGEPIVEKIDEALSLFSKSRDVRFMFLNDYLIEKNDAIF